MRNHLSARVRLTLLYTTLFAIGGGALVAVTYLLVAHTLRITTPPALSRSIQQLVARCVQAVQTRGRPGAIQKCGTLYLNGVQAGTRTQRDATLTHLLTFSSLGLAVVTLLAVAAGWLVAGRILQPVHRLTAAARAASEQDLSQRLALHGPRDELQELADTFDTMLDRLERAFSSQQQFIANASHELRTPLTVMRTAVDVVLAKPHPTPADLASMSTEVRQAIGSADRLIDALLVLARNEQVRVLTEALDLAAIVQDTMDGRRTGTVTITTALHDAPVTGDGVLIERLVTNLVDNAERYNVAGGVIWITTATDQADSILRIVNTGPVVPPDHIDRLFLPFGRLDERTRHDGFGLGLTLVASIAAVHNATIDTVAVPTGGLDITIRFPGRELSKPTSNAEPSS